MIQAVILAGGAGTRLRPLTYRMPKPMVPVNGRPFLDYLVAYLAGQGVDDIVMCTGYKSEVIESYFSDSDNTHGTTITCSREPEFYGTGGALLLARERGLLRPEFLLVYGDSYFPIPVSDLRTQFIEEQQRGARAMLSVYRNTAPRICPQNVMVDTERARVRLYDKTVETPDMNGVEAGLSAFTHRIFEFMPPLKTLSSHKQCSLEMDIYPRLIEQDELAAYCTDQRFYDMGTPAGLELVGQVLSQDANTGSL